MDIVVTSENTCALITKNFLISEMKTCRDILVLVFLAERKNVCTVIKRVNEHRQIENMKQCSVAICATFIYVEMVVSHLFMPRNVGNLCRISVLWLYIYIYMSSRSTWTSPSSVYNVHYIIIQIVHKVKIS